METNTSDTDKLIEYGEQAYARLLPEMCGRNTGMIGTVFFKPSADGTPTLEAKIEPHQVVIGPYSGGRSAAAAAGVRVAASAGGGVANAMLPMAANGTRMSETTAHAHPLRPENGAQKTKQPPRKEGGKKRRSPASIATSRARANQFRLEQEAKRKEAAPPAAARSAQPCADGTAKLPDLVSTGALAGGGSAAASAPTAQARPPPASAAPRPEKQAREEGGKQRRSPSSIASSRVRANLFRLAQEAKRVEAAASPAPA